MKMRRLPASLALALALLMGAGCATTMAVHGRIHREPLPVYPATLADGLVIYRFGLVGRGFYCGMSDSRPSGAPDPEIGFGWRVVALFGGLIDLPVSLCTDTLFLPYDAICWARRPRAPREKAPAVTRPVTTSDYISITLRVVDEKLRPIADAWVAAGATNGLNGCEGRTYGSGLFPLQGSTTSSLPCRIDKPGYYSARGDLREWVGRGTGHLAGASTNCTVVLKQVVDPVPMVRHSVRTRLPDLAKAHGFDLERGDWVAPDGAGIRADIALGVAYQRDSGTNRVSALILTITNANDGIMACRSNEPVPSALQSDLVQPRIAPTSGYERRITLVFQGSPRAKAGNAPRTSPDYILRVRSTPGGTTSPPQANYIWAPANFGIDPGQDPAAPFTLEYLYNPDPDSRSLEPADRTDAK